MAKQLLLNRNGQAFMINVGEVQYSLCTPNAFGCYRDGKHQRIVKAATRNYGLEELPDRLSSFAAWDECFASVKAGKIPICSAEMSEALGRITDNVEALLHIEEVLEKVDVRTPLREAARLKKNSYGLLASDSQLEPDGERLLRDVRDAQQRYSGFPEMLGFGTNNVRSQNPQLRWGKLARYMANHPRNPLSANWQLNWVAYELKPLNIRGLKWKGDPGGGTRTESIDHLMEFQNCPVLVEAKTATDCGATATTRALSQVLYYGSTMANDAQMRRVSKQFKNISWNMCPRPWLALLIEQRPDTGFNSDWQQVLSFARHPSVTQTLGNWFSGLFQIMIKGNEQGTQWSAVPGQQHCFTWP